MKPHGTATRYTYGCRCTRCTAAKLAHNKAWRIANPERHTKHRRKIRARRRVRHNKTQRERRAHDPEFRERCREAGRRATPKTAEGRRDQHLRKRFKISLAEWDQLFNSQDRRCRCCGTTTPGSKTGWATDHDHATGAIRGITCQRCNRVLGVLGDNAAGVQAACQLYLTYLSLAPTEVTP